MDVLTASGRARPLPRGAVALLGLLLTAPGCARWGVATGPLTPAELDALAARARTTAEAGLTAVATEQGLQISPVRIADPGPARAALSFQTRRRRGPAAPVIHVAVNGRRTLALVDTGSTATLMDRRGAERVGLVPLRRPASGEAPGPYGDDRGLLYQRGMGTGAGFVQIVSLADTLRIDDVEFRRVPVGILNRREGFGASGWIDGERVEMILGLDVLSLFDRVTLDFPRDRLCATRGDAGGASGDPATGAFTVPMTGPYPVPLLEAELDGAGRLTVLLDSGAEAGLWIPGTQAAQLDLPELHDPRGTRTGYGAGGAAAYRPIGFRTVRLGDHVLREVQTMVGQTNLAGAPFPWALLGRQALGRYAVTIDFHRRLVHFQAP